MYRFKIKERESMKKILLSAAVASGLLVSSVFAETVDLTNGLVAHYEFEDNANDSSGNNYNGTVHGTEAYTNGVMGKGIKLENYLDLVEFDSSILNNEINTTVSFWASFEDYNKGTGLISTIKGTGNNNDYLIYLKSDGKMSTVINDIEYIGENSINNNLFHLISVTTTPENIKIYIDGTLDSEFNTTVNSFTTDSSIWFGNDQDSLNGGWDSNQQFSGIVDDLRFYNRTLNSSEINQLYKTGSSNIIASTELQYADIVLDSHYSGVNTDFSSFYGGITGGSEPELAPVKYVADGNLSTAISLPTGSYITVGFSRTNIIDAPNQDDIFIVEDGNGDENAEIYVSSDFKNFTYLGSAFDNSTTSFDLEDINFTEPVVAVKIVGLDNGGSWPGFDLVEVKGLAGSLVEDNSQCQEVVEIYAKSPNTNKWITFSNPCDIPEDWESTIQKPIENLLVDCNNSTEVQSNITQDKIETLSTGWHLLGTATDINDTSIFDNTNAVWKYDNGWKAYSPNSATQSLIEATNSIDTLENIGADKGFWINK